MSAASDIIPWLFSPAKPSRWQSGAFRCNRHDKSQAEAESGANAKRSESCIVNNFATARIAPYYLSPPLELHILNCPRSEFQRVDTHPVESLTGRRLLRLQCSSASSAPVLQCRRFRKVGTESAGRCWNG